MRPNYMLIPLVFGNSIIFIVIFPMTEHESTGIIALQNAIFMFFFFEKTSKQLSIC